MAKRTKNAAPKAGPTGPAKTAEGGWEDLSYDLIGRVFTEYARLAREHDGIRARDPFDGTVTPRGELTRAVNEKLALARELAYQLLDGGGR